MVEKILLIVVIANAALAGAKLALDKLVAKFPSLQTADTIAGSLVAVTGKILDFISANVAHAQVAAPAPAPEAPKA